MTNNKPPSDAAMRYQMKLQAQRIEAMRKKDPSSQKPAPGKRIDPNSPEGRAIAERYTKSKR
jgi:hypothetical protein